MKKIVYLMEYPIDLPGGAQMSTFSICDALAKDPSLGYEPVVICPKLLQKRPEDYSFRIDEYDMGDSRAVNLLIRIKAFRRYIRKEMPDLIHIEMQESLITYGFVRRCFRGLPYIFTDRGLFFGYRKRSRLFMDPVLKHASMMVTTTEFNRDLWLAGSGIRPISVIHNTISSEYFGSFEESRKRVNPRPVVGLAGRICVEKDWPMACSFIERLASLGADFDVEIVLATFEKGDVEECDRIVSRLQAALGPDRVRAFFNLSQQEMADFYYGVDVFLMTSCFESFGKAAVEAMSRRCALVSTSVGGLPEVIGKDEDLYTAEDMDRGIRRVKELISDRGLLESEGQYFLDRYRELFTEKIYIERHVKLYNELIGR